MLRNRIVGAVAALAVLAFAAMPAVAQATESHWFRKGKEVPLEAPQAMHGKGTLTVHFLTGSQAGTQVHCKAEYKGELWNPAPRGAGEANFNTVTFSKCSETPTGRCTVKPLGLPWHATLFRASPDEGETVEDAQLETNCTPGAVSQLAGALSGPVVHAETPFVGTLSNVEAGLEAEVALDVRLKSFGPGQIFIAP